LRINSSEIFKKLIRNFFNYQFYSVLFCYYQKDYEKDCKRGDISTPKIPEINMTKEVSLTKNFRELLFCLKLMRENTWQTIENNLSTASQSWFSFFTFLSQRLGGFLK